MKPKYYPPEFEKKQFNCPHCGVFAEQQWRDVTANTYNHLHRTPFKAAFCVHCEESSYWFDGRMLVPNDTPIELPHPDLPDACRLDYEEAREIVSRSPRGAVALLRLCLQKLMPELGEKGKHINDDIKSLVASGLSSRVQQALDICRVVGNNAVHPGELNISDTPEIAYSLFRMINFIVEDRITKPKEIEVLYSQLPIGALNAIEKRDGV